MANTPNSSTLIEAHIIKTSTQKRHRQEQKIHKINILKQVEVNYTKEYINSLYSFGTKKNCTQEWKESIVPIHKKGDRIDCNNYRGISLFSTSYKILSNIISSKMTPYANGIIGESQCGIRTNRSTVDHTFSIRQILQKKWEYNNAVCQLFIDFEKANDSINRESFYNVLIEFGVPKT